MVAAISVTTRNSGLLNVGTPEPVHRVNSRRAIQVIKTSAVTEIATPVATSILAGCDLLAGQGVYIASDGKLYLANANTTACIGLALKDAKAGAATFYTDNGSVSRDNWLDVIGTYQLTIGATYYLVGVGCLTRDVPTTGLLQVVGIAASTTMLDVEVQQAIRLA